jgi:superoxide reductase
MVEVVHNGAGTLTCCNQPMQLMTENTEDADQEKHVPVIEKTDTGVRIKVGSVAHPMEEKHYIEWIEILANGRVYRKHLAPGQKAEAEFNVKAEKIIAREYCNIHGLWKAES